MSKQQVKNLPVEFQHNGSMYVSRLDVPNKDDCREFAAYVMSLAKAEKAIAIAGDFTAPQAMGISYYLGKMGHPSMMLLPVGNDWEIFREI